MPSAFAGSTYGFSNSPRSNLSFSTRRTAWSIRPRETDPSRTFASSNDVNSAAFDGSIAMSTPALTLIAIAVL
ncbi:hypothetical protein BBK82_04290 [Lentzea guizhouensis]|uniref:Uncharacterized protein n=1 Tax=Lentzea guizhouensis TaxID=1586287 RepID=A0A1B2HCK7_9PSEU|nr:hypothetical protein BBK82_04290 [Lentzea guizhouensis]